MPLVRQRPQRLGQELELAHLEADLAPAGPEHLATNADDVTEVEVVEQPHAGLAERVLAGVELDLAAAVDQVGKGNLALAPMARDAAGNRHRPKPRLSPAVGLLLGCLERRHRVGGEVAAVEAERERLDARRAQRLELFDPLQPEIVTTTRGLRQGILVEVHGRED